MASKRHHRFSERSVEDVTRAGECFSAAVALDDNFAAAHLALGQHLLNLAVLGFVSPQQVAERGRPEIERALALDDHLGEAHAANGVFRALFDFDWAGAERAFEAALSREPGSPVIHRLHALAVLAPLLRLEEAETEVRCALELDPICPESHFMMALMLFFRREYVRAEASIRTTLELGAANPLTLLRIPSPVDHDSEVPPIIVPMIGEVVPPARCGAVQAERNKARKDDDDESRYLADVIDFGSER